MLRRSLQIRNRYLQTNRLLSYLQPASNFGASKIIPSRDYSQSSGKGDDVKEHSVKRAKKGDTRDPAAAAVASGMEEREANEWIADDSKSGATTERGGSKHAQKAKRDHPAAPEPIIGMNDERARKGD